MENLRAEDVFVYEVGTIEEYREKVAAAERRFPIAIEARNPHSELPTVDVGFPAVRVVVDMWKIVKSRAARAATLREALAA